MDKNDINNIKEGANLVKNAKSGNIKGAAKNVINLAKSKKNRKRFIIKCIFKILPWLLSVIFVFAIFTGVVNILKELGTKVGTVVTGFFRWMSDDYWIDLDKKIDFSEEGNGSEKMTLVDKYITELDKTGVSLKDLRILGDADYSDMDKLLEDGENKELVQKYISEFMRADIITQEFHKRRGTELVKRENENLVDGGIYLYRSTKETTIKEGEFANGNTYSGENVGVTEKDYTQMTYIDKDKFIEKVNKNSKDAMYEFSLDKETGELLVAKVTTTKVIEGDVSNTLNTWFSDLYRWLSDNDLAGRTEYQMELIRIPYKDYISKYTMPYEFLLNLCMITANPEFAYHVALLARNTKIVLAIQDNTTIERESIEIEEKEQSYKNSGSSSSQGATVTGTNNKKVRKVTTKTTLTPNLLVEYADTWSFYEEFEYTKNVSGELKQEPPKEEKPGIPSTLSGYQEKTTYIEYTYQGVPIERVNPGYWYDTFVVERKTSTQTINTSVTYNPPILKNSVEKSKQFLGLLRNHTGKCTYDDCFTSWNQAKYCAEDAVFNKNGINVQYRIPNIDREEPAYNKLKSGLDMLYSFLESNYNGNNTDDSGYDPNEDYDSIYYQKMQGLAEHIRYLMTFPPNESYTVKDLILDDIGNIFDSEDDVITDEGTIASAREIYEFLVGKGMTPESACGILGNIQQESSFNTAASNGTHFGLCQWGGGRWEGLKQFASQEGKSWTDLNTQLNYLWSELCGSKSNVKDAIINSTDVEYATDIFCRKFEICGNYGIEVPRRYRYAKHWYNLFVSGTSDYVKPSEMQDKLLDIIDNLSDYGGIANGDGMCQAFIRTVYEKLGIRGSAASASAAERQWKVSSDMNNIPVGATVYGKGSSSDGHVGIYIGNGNVVHNIGKSANCSYAGLKGIKCESISSWNRKYKFTSWGWQAGVDLTK